MRRAQVCIIGAGPAGLLLGHLLRAEGIDCLVLDRQSPDYILGRIRAGVLETITVSLMERLGLDTRLKAEGLWHDGFQLADGERLIRIDLADLTGSRVDCRFIVGCDGFHGPSRKAIPANAGKGFERVYPFGWLGILADVPPCHHELIYASHERGFALASMRSETRSRYYVDVPAGEDVANWPDERVWDELALRLGEEAAAGMVRGPSIEKSIAPLRSFVFEPMRHGSLLLCGDAAHIVPPTGAKGLNLAASDVYYAAEALTNFFAHNSRDAVAAYSTKALARVWKAERFSWSLTRLMHRFPEDGAFERKMQLAELDYIASSRAAQQSIAENYVGLPV